MLCGAAWRLRLPSEFGAAVVHVERFRLCGCSSHRSHQPRAARVTREALSAEQISGFGKSDSRACGERARGERRWPPGARQARGKAGRTLGETAARKLGEKKGCLL